MKKFLFLIFTWWHGSTWGTSFFTWRRGKKVGEDQAGNVYYRDRKNAKRRWVLYNGDAEASKISADWHAWMHGMTDESPADQAPEKFAWELEHQANMTGTSKAYHPQGSLLANEPSVPGEPAYEPWLPKS